MIKELLEIDREWNRIYDAFYKKRAETIKRVLPVGTKVTWRHGAGEIKGEVVKLPEWGGEYIDVKNIASGKTRQIKAGSLSLDPIDSGKAR